MTTNNQATIIKTGNEQRDAVIALLQSANLPVKDLPNTLDNFFVALHDGKVIGAIGLEQYGDCGLLRSMVVDQRHRNKNIASQLVLQLEQYATSKGIHSIYLLTETAPLFFERKAYNKITREEVPKALQASSEFSHVCPVSAIVMHKQLQ